MNDDLLKRLTNEAAADQAATGLVEIARVLATYHSALLEEGLRDGLADELVIEFQRLQLFRASGRTRRRRSEA